MRLKNEILQQIRADENLARKLVTALEVKNILTVIRMTYRNSKRFTELPSLTAIAEYTGQPVENLYVENADDMGSVEQGSVELAAK